MVRALILAPVAALVAVVAPAAGAPPEVTITAPGAYVNQGHPDPFTVTAEVPTGDATSVEFFRCDDMSAGCSAGTWISLGADDAAPYSAAWDVNMDGNRALRAVASNGAEVGSDIVNVTIDRTHPTGGLNAPADGAFVAGTVTLTASAADSGSGVDSVTFQRRPAGGGNWTAVGSDSTAPYAVDWDASALPGGDYDLRVVVDDVAQNSAESAARSVTVDNTPPSIATLAPLEVSGGSKQFFDPGPDTFYFRPVGPGSFRLRASLSDAESGDDRVTFPNLENVAGWAGTGGADVAGPSPYMSLVYDWTHGATSPGTRTITGRNGANLAASTTITIVADSDAPSGGSISYPAGYDADGNVTITTTDGTDTGSGVDLASSVLERQTAALTGGSCDTFGAWAEVASPNAVASRLCAQYRYRIFDRVGNQAVHVGGIVKVDTEGPSAPGLTLSEASPFAAVSGSGSEIFVNTNHPGSFTVAATTNDPTSGIEKVRFPGSNDDTTAPFSFTYDFGELTAAQTVTVFDNGGNTASATFDVTRDTAEPTGGSVSYPTGYHTAGAVTLTLSNGSDSGAGIALASALLERQTAPLSGGSCGAFGAWAEVTSPDTVGSGLCAQYRYRISDRVGNEAVFGPAGVVKVDTASPSPPDLALSEASPFAAVSGNEIFVNAAHTGSFDVTATTGDLASGVEKVRFPGPVDDFTEPYEASYDFPLVEGIRNVRAYDGAGNTANAIFEVTSDTAEPAGGSVSYTNDYDSDGTVTIVAASGTDALSGIDASSRALERRTAPLSGNTCGAFSAPWSLVSSPDTLAPNTCAQYRHRVSDRVGNEAIYPSANVVRFDTARPGNVTGASATAGDHVVTLRWTLPPDADLGAIRILRWRAGGAPTQVLLAKTTSFRDRAVLNGVKYSYKLLSRDRAGNQSTGVVLTATPKSVYLISPKDGAVLRRPPLLDWRPKAGATYYNVQLWRNGVKILSRHPSRSQFQLRSSWRHEGRAYRLGPGRYRWLVWPGFGRPSAARFGRQMGWSDFRVPS
jgi:Bacterial Ig domain